MKHLKYIPSLGLALMLFASCDSDLDTVSYNQDTAKPANITALADAYVLNNKQLDENVIKLTWKAPEMGYYAAVTNNVEIDLEENNFSDAKVMASLPGGTELGITNAQLNGKILELLGDKGIEDSYDPVKVSFRIKTTISDAVEPLVSNVVTTTVTPFSADIDYPKVYVIGDYCGWGFDNTQHLFSFKSNTTYSGVVDFGDKAANGFKITGEPGWNDACNYGTDGSAPAPAAEASKIQLISSGGSGNISCYSKRFYHFTFNTSSLELVKDFGFDVLGVIGDAANGWGDADDIEMSFDPVKQRFYADVELKDGSIKFRLDHSWTTSWGSKTEGLLDAGDNINVTAGKYRVYVDLNNSDKLTYKLSEKDFGK